MTVHSGQRIRRLPGRAGPRPRTWPLHRALAPPVPCEPPPEGFHAAQGPAHSDRPRDQVRARRRCTPPSGYLTGLSAARVHHPGSWT